MDLLSFIHLRQLIITAAKNLPWELSAQQIEMEAAQEATLAGIWSAFEKEFSERLDCCEAVLACLPF